MIFTQPQAKSSRPTQLTQDPWPLHLLASIVPSHLAPTQSGDKSLIAAAKIAFP